MNEKLRELMSSLPDGFDLRSYLGSTPPQRDSSLLSNVAIFAAGLALGAGLVYLLSPNGDEEDAEQDPSRDEPAVAP